MAAEYTIGRDESRTFFVNTGKAEALQRTKGFVPGPRGILPIWAEMQLRLQDSTKITPYESFQVGQRPEADCELNQVHTLVACALHRSAPPPTVDAGEHQENPRKENNT